MPTKARMTPQKMLLPVLWSARPTVRPAMAMNMSYIPVLLLPHKLSIHSSLSLFSATYAKNAFDVTIMFNYYAHSRLYRKQNPIQP